MLWTMYPIQLEVAPTATRNRVTTLLRIFMLIPHMIVLYLWGIAFFVVMVIQWFAIVFTGKRSQGLFDFQRKFVAYAANVGAYGYLLHDKFPAFGPDDPASPVRFSARYDETGNRLTTLLRYFTQIPAAIISGVIGFGAFLAALVSWFAIVFTGKQPQGLFDFITKSLRYAMQVGAYGYLMTDEYPWPKAAGF